MCNRNQQGSSGMFKRYNLSVNSDMNGVGDYQRAENK